MAYQEALTQDQLEIVFTLQRDVCELMKRAEYALKCAGIPGFADMDIVHNAVATIGEKGWRDTLEALSEV